MNVMIIVESWGKGGTETYVAGLVKMLVNKKYKVSIVLLKRGEEDTIDFLPKESVFVTGFTGLVTLLRREQQDLISLHLYTSLLPVVLISRLLRIPVVSTLHITISSWGIRHRIYWQVAALLSNAVAGVSNMIVNQIRCNKKVERSIPGGVEAQFFKVMRATRKIGDDFNIIAMGRLEYQKDWPTLIEAVSLLPDSIRDQVFINFYGSGILQTDLEKLSREKGVKAVFHGYVEKSNLTKALASTDISVLPSRFEGLPLSGIEGMASSVPTITADFAAANEFIEHGVTGHIYAFGDARALSQWIEWHINNPAESEEIGRAGRDFIQEHFSEDVTYLPYLDIFERIVR